MRQELWSQLRPYRERYPGSRWTQPHSWHVTLLFLGDVAVEEIDVLKQLAASVALRSGGPFRASARLGDGRVQRSEGVAWLGLDEGAGRVIEIATSLLEGCPAGTTRGPAPKRTPSAHLTVARKTELKTIEALRSQACGPIGASWAVTSIALMRSHLDPGGARYETLHRSAL